MGALRALSPSSTPLFTPHSPPQFKKAIEIIKHITEYREKRSGEDTSSGGQERGKVDTAECRYTLGLLFMYTGEVNVARVLGSLVRFSGL